MSVLTCRCGHILKDQSNHNKYKGYILLDTKEEDFWDTFVRVADDLANANKAGQRQEWIENNFLSGYPTDITDGGMLFDLLHEKFVHCTKDIFECENCGSVLIQKTKTQQFQSFTPDNNTYNKILNDF